MEKDCKDAWKSLPSEVQSLYGSEYVNTLIQGTRFSGTVGSQTTTACVDAMVDALVNTCPKSRYLVHGGERWFDIWSVSTVNFHGVLNMEKVTYMSISEFFDGNLFL